MAIRASVARVGGESLGEEVGRPAPGVGVVASKTPCRVAGLACARRPRIRGAHPNPMHPNLGRITARSARGRCRACLKGPYRGLLGTLEPGEASSGGLCGLVSGVTDGSRPAGEAQAGRGEKGSRPAEVRRDRWRRCRRTRPRWRGRVRRHRAPAPGRRRRGRPRGFAPPPGRRSAVGRAAPAARTAPASTSR